MMSHVFSQRERERKRERERERKREREKQRKQEIEKSDFQKMSTHYKKETKLKIARKKHPGKVIKKVDDCRCFNKQPETK